MTRLCALQIPCIFRETGKIRSGDGFADDCLHSHQVSQAKAETSHGFPVLKDGPFILDGSIGEPIVVTLSQDLARVVATATLGFDGNEDKGTPSTSKRGIVSSIHEALQFVSYYHPRVNPAFVGGFAALESL